MTLCDSLAQTRKMAQKYRSRILIAPPTSAVAVWVCVTSYYIIPHGILRYNSMERRYGQYKYSVTNCWNVCAMFGCGCHVSTFDI